MRVARIGLTPVKGLRHSHRTQVDLSATGPLGDREFCVIDRGRHQVLRTVQHPQLLGLSADWASGVLQVDFAGSVIEGEPRVTGEVLDLDYWGRPVAVDVIQGLWAARFSEFLGRPVCLGRIRTPGAVVFGASVTLVLTEAVRSLWADLAPDVTVDPVAISARFRATFTLDSTGEEDFHSGLVGRRVSVGSASLRVVGPVARCAVVNLDPDSGAFSGSVLPRLRRSADGEPIFGWEAVVESPGRVLVGDAWSLVKRTTGSGRSRMNSTRVVILDTGAIMSTDNVEESTDQRADMQDPEQYGGLSIEDDPGGTTDPAELAGTKHASDDEVGYEPNPADPPEPQR